jgi:hypothetical protein
VLCVAIASMTSFVNAFCMHRSSLEGTEGWRRDTYADCTKAQESGRFYVIDDIDQVRQGRTLVVSTGEDCNASQ